MNIERFLVLKEKKDRKQVFSVFFFEKNPFLVSELPVW